MKTLEETTVNSLIQEFELNDLMGKIIEHCFNQWNEKDMFIANRIKDFVKDFLEIKLQQAGEVAVREERKKYKKLKLVPVEVFGTEDGYGLMDSIEPWSDCNRADGHIYRIDDTGLDKGTIEILVDKKLTNLLKGEINI